MFDPIQSAAVHNPGSHQDSLVARSSSRRSSDASGQSAQKAETVASASSRPAPTASSALRYSRGRLTKKAEALIAAVYLSGTNTRRVKRALFGLFEGAVSKDVVSRAWRKVKVDWDARVVRAAWPMRTSSGSPALSDGSRSRAHSSMAP